MALWVVSDKIRTFFSRCSSILCHELSLDYAVTRILRHNVTDKRAILYKHHFPLNGQTSCKAVGHCVLYHMSNNTQSSLVSALADITRMLVIIINWNCQTDYEFILVCKV